MQRRQRTVSVWTTFGPMVLAALGSGVGISLLLVAIVLGFAQSVQAGSLESSGLIRVELDEVRQGSLLFKTDERSSYLSAPVLHSEVSINVTAMVARITLRQRFINGGNVWVEGVYVFPLPETAAVDHMRLQIGDRRIEDEIRGREEAKRIYHTAKMAGNKASLLEQERANLFTTSVANIGPGEEVTVEIEFQQQVDYEQGQFSLRFPMTMTPRYIPDGLHSSLAGRVKAVRDASRIVSPMHVGNEEINTVTLRADINMGIPLESVESLYHPIDKNYLDGGHVIVSSKARVRSDRDFVLSWTPQAATMPRVAHFVESRGDHDYHLVMIVPPEFKEDALLSSLAKEVVYIIDTSGSMEGESMVQAKQALLMAVARLNPEDRFNIIAFNSVTSSLYETVRPASSENVRQAINYVRDLSAGGGTEMYPALHVALKPQNADARISQVIFITDGSVGNEAELFSLINANLGQRRLFTVGIGSAPNSYFMKKAAQFGRGTYTYIGSSHEVESRMNTLFEKLARPVMTNLNVKWSRREGLEMWPSQLPDIYMGEPVTFIARSAQPQSQIDITGERGAVHWQARFSLSEAQEGKGLGVLWARKKIERLMDGLFEGVNEADVKRSVIDIALSHHIVSKYTSLVAVDVTPSRPEGVSVERKFLANNMPYGSKHSLYLDTLADTATAGELNFFIGIFLLLSAVFLLLIGERWRLNRLKTEIKYNRIIRPICLIPKNKAK